MDHTLAHLQDSVIKERKRVEFLESIIKTYSSHVWNDVQHTLNEDYPRATYFNYDRDYKIVS